MTPTVNGVYTGAFATEGTPTVNLPTAPATGDLLVLFYFQYSSTTSIAPTAVNGCGATWTEFRPPTNSPKIRIWIGRGATSAGTVTPVVTAGSFRGLQLFHLSGVVDYFFMQEGLSGLPGWFPAQASPGQIAIGGVQKTNTDDPLTSVVPADGWTIGAAVPVRFDAFRSGYRIPSATALHEFIPASSGYGWVLVVGSPVPDTVVSRHNLCGNSSLSLSTAWESPDVGVDVSSTRALFGATSMRLMPQSNVAVGTLRRSVGTFGQHNGPCFAGRTYTISAYVWVDTPGRSGVVYPTWLNYANNSNGMPAPAPGATTPIPVGQWFRLSWTGVAPGGAQPAWGVHPNIQIGPLLDDEMVYVDGILVEEADTALPYFDGSTVTAGATNVYNGPTSVYQSYQLAPLEPPVPPVTFEQWNGTAWVEDEAVPNVWNGTAWEQLTPKRWDGNAWVDVE